MQLVFLGPPGAGKGTQAEKCVQHYQIAHISTGDMLRAQIKAKTPLGEKAQSYMNQGALVPDDVILGMMGERFKQPDCQNGFLLDGFPRTLVQAEALSEITAVHCVIDIEVPDAQIVKRLSGRRVCPACAKTYHVSLLEGKTACECGTELITRPDDEVKTVENRLRTYHSQTSPLIAYYENKGVLKRIDGTKDMDAVFAQIRTELDKL